MHGNVDTLLQDYGGLLAASDTNHFKRIVYNYDLVSGKVNQVNYQPGGGDGYRHRYEYDAENRLTAVWTSRDGLLWERDGSYQYYRHGPLGRMVVGHQQVQGLDYRYTLQGWLKGVNGLADAGSAGTDSSGSCQAGTAPDDLVVSARPLVVPPQLVARSSIEFRQGFESQAGDSFETLLDASLGVCQSSGSGGGGAVTYPASAESFPVARDAAAFSLHYYGQDYKAISSSAAPADALTALGSQAAPLYNGNIAAMAVNVPKVGQGLLYNYRYDQLNRLVSMDAYKGLGATGSFTPVSVEDYQERVGYDPNGNILTYLRNGTLSGGRQLAMDTLSYHYIANTNRLSSISDRVAGSNYTEDIDSMVQGNYRYDAIGNLKSDSSQLITNIDWTVYGKIAGISKPGGQILYSYDASGNRVLKVAGGTTTLYVRDASGNVMSVYERQGAAMMEQKEVHLYGSSRLGIVRVVGTQPVAINVESSYGEGKVSTFSRGEKLFEVSNHLGNVLATVADRRTQHTSGGSTVDYYQAEVVSATDYAPFGMGLVGRTYNSSRYRAGFNGKENDNETSTQDYGMRIYNPRVARFLSVDPIAKSYPELTPYQFASNRPIDGIDLDGLEHYYAADGTLIARSTVNNTQVRLIKAENLTSFKSLSDAGKLGTPTADRLSVDVGMTNEELNTRAFMSTLKQTENHGNDPLPYNAMHGFSKGKVKTFTDKSYEEAPGDYKAHPYDGKKGGTAAGAYQLLRPTFNAQKKSNPLVVDFGPSSQDYAVLGIFKTPGIDALEPIKVGNLSVTVQKLIKDKWGNTQFASLPGGGQEAPDMTMEKLRELFKKNVSNELNGNSNISIPKGETLKNPKEKL